MEDSVASGMVSGPTKEALRGTKGWVKLVGVLLFIGAGLTILGAVAMLAGAAMGGMGAMGGSKQGPAPFALMAVMCVFYLAFAAVYFFMGMYLFNYSNAIGRLLADDQVSTLETALQSQQKFWKLAGIIALVGVVLGIIGIIAAIAIPFFVTR